jgi:hypothetical protein
VRRNRKRSFLELGLGEHGYRSAPLPSSFAFPDNVKVYVCCMGIYCDNIKKGVAFVVAEVDKFFELLSKIARRTQLVAVFDLRAVLIKTRNVAGLTGHYRRVMVEEIPRIANLLRAKGIEVVLAENEGDKILAGEHCVSNDTDAVMQASPGKQVVLLSSSYSLKDAELFEVIDAKKARNAQLVFRETVGQHRSGAFAPSQAAVLMEMIKTSPDGIKGLNCRASEMASLNEAETIRIRGLTGPKDGPKEVLSVVLNMPVEELPAAAENPKLTAAAQIVFQPTTWVSSDKDSKW